MPHTFIVQSIGGHVFERAGKGRFPIRKLLGPATPVETVKDQAKAAFDDLVAAELPPRIEHEIGAIFSRRASEGIGPVPTGPSPPPVPCGAAAARKNASHAIKK